MVKNISIFCGAHEGTNPNYALEAKKITALLSKKGVDVVFGGGNVGIMKLSLMRQKIIIQKSPA